MELKQEPFLFYLAELEHWRRAWRWARVMLMVAVKFMSMHEHAARGVSIATALCSRGVQMNYGVLYLPASLQTLVSLRSKTNPSPSGTVGEQKRAASAHVAERASETKNITQHRAWRLKRPSMGA